MWNSLIFKTWNSHSLCIENRKNAENSHFCIQKSIKVFRNSYTLLIPETKTVINFYLGLEFSNEKCGLHFGDFLVYLGVCVQFMEKPDIGHWMLPDRCVERICHKYVSNVEQGVSKNTFFPIFKS